MAITTNRFETSPFVWPSPTRQARAHALTTRSTPARQAPVKPVPCADCHLVHRGTC